MIAEWESQTINVSKVVERSSDIDGYEMRICMTIPGSKPLYFAAHWRCDEPEPDVWKVIGRALHEACEVSGQYFQMLMEHGKFNWEKAVS